MAILSIATAEARTSEIGPGMQKLEGQGVQPGGLVIGATRHFRTLYAAASDPGGPSAGIARARPPVFGPRRSRMQKQAERWGVRKLGDALQFMKAGIMEVPDLIAVTKSDMGDVAQRTATDLKGSLGLNSEGVEPEVLLCSSATGDGVADLVHRLTVMAAQNSSRFDDSRDAKLIRWADEQINTRFGSFGIEVVHRLCGARSGRFSFCEGNQRKLRLAAAFSETFL